jgi:hypothetical protein
MVYQRARQPLLRHRRARLASRGNLTKLYDWGYCPTKAAFSCHPV